MARATRHCGRPASPGWSVVPGRRPPPQRDGLPAALRHPAARRIAAVADGAELVADKLPMTPSRLDPPGLAGRLISAGLAALGSG
jgi:hypothetical protein